MAIRISSNIDYKGQHPLDTRQEYDSLTALKAASDQYYLMGIYDGLLANLKTGDADHRSGLYIFNSANDNDPVLGKWRFFIDRIKESDIDTLFPAP